MNTKFIITILSCFLLFSSCNIDDFLSEDVYDRIVGAEHYATPDGIKSGVDGVYSRLRDYNGFWGWNLALLKEGPLDMFRDGNSVDEPFMNYLFPTDLSHFNEPWNVLWTTINQANTVLDMLDSEIENLPDGLRIRYQAEVRFLRAYLYKELITQWGDVELRTHATTEPELKSFRTPQAEIWDFIIEELEFCRANLPETYPSSETGRVTSIAADHFLARSLLFARRDNSASVQKAATLCENIINSGYHTLVDDHATLFNIDNQKNPEVIWAIQFTDDMELNENGNWIHTQYTSSYSSLDPTIVNRVIAWGRPWTRMQPSMYLMSLFDEEIDKRWHDNFMHHWTVTMPNATAQQFNPWTKEIEEIEWPIGDTVFMMFKPPYVPTPEDVLEKWPTYVYVYPTIDKWGDETGYNITEDMIQSPDNPNAPYPSNTRILFWGRLYPGLMKFEDPNRSREGENRSGRDLVVYRLADTYLLAAEAYWLMGDPGKAAEFVNVIRERAAWPGKEQDMRITAADIDMDFLLDERGLELCGELYRWVDLKRFGQLEARATNPKFNPRLADRWRSHHYYRPIPQQFLDLLENPEDFPQNSGY